MTLRLSSRSFLILFAALSLSAGCASREPMPPPPHHGGQMDCQMPGQGGDPIAIMLKASNAFSNAPGLTESQKEQVAEIYRKTFSDAMAIRKQIGEAKDELFTVIAKVDYRSSQVEKLKTKIVDLDQKRLKLMFKALADVQAVVGYGKDKEELYRHMRDYEIPAHGLPISEK